MKKGGFPDTHSKPNPALDGEVQQATPEPEAVVEEDASDKKAKKGGTD
jgi:hypothetical protein